MSLFAHAGAEPAGISPGRVAEKSPHPLEELLLPPVLDRGLQSVLVTDLRNQNLLQEMLAQNRDSFSCVTRTFPVHEIHLRNLYTNLKEAFSNSS
jgi:hypothetical protein